MIDASALPLSSWESFYVIVGSSGAALTGLQFVVIALVADSRRLRRARMQTGYRPVWEDWLWHTILPLAAYFAFTISGVVLSSYTTVAMFTVGAMWLLLLLIGIHNAWDTVTYIAVVHTGQPPPENGPSS